MAAAGVRLHFPLTDLAVMWFGRAMLNLPTFFKVARQADIHFRTVKPDALILTDYPGFHFALAKRAKPGRGAGVLVRPAATLGVGRVAGREDAPVRHGRADGVAVRAGLV